MLVIRGLLPLPVPACFYLFLTKTAFTVCFVYGLRIPCTLTDISKPMGGVCYNWRYEIDIH